MLALVLPNTTKSFLPLMDSKLICFLIKIISFFFSLIVGKAALSASDLVPLTGLLLFRAVEASFSLNEKLDASC